MWRKVNFPIIHFNYHANPGINYTLYTPKRSHIRCLKHLKRDKVTSRTKVFGAKAWKGQHTSQWVQINGFGSRFFKGNLEGWVPCVYFTAYDIAQTLLQLVASSKVLVRSAPFLHMLDAQRVSLKTCPFLLSVKHYCSFTWDTSYIRTRCC
jgi:hypothetical protein